METSPQIQYAELHCLTNFTFLRGASHPEELVLRAQALNYSALAITDECSLAGVVRAHFAAKEAGLKLIIGSEFKIDDMRFILLAMNREGYGNLSQLITQARRVATKGEYRLAKENISEGLNDCIAILLSDPLPTLEQVNWLAKRFAQRCWIAVELLRHHNDDGLLSHLQQLSQGSGVPLVASGDVHMHRRNRRVLQDTMTCIRLGCTLQQAGRALHANGERHLRPLNTLSKLYPAALLQETIKIATLCDFSLDSLRYEYPHELIPAGETPSSHLRKLTEQGKQQRWGNKVLDPVKAQEVEAQIEYELALIKDLRYEPYFLTVHDIVRYARSQNIYCQGRGSAANSAVCYCLGITEVDPQLQKVLVERFISRERNEPPDIDVDFEHERREEVIQYVYAKYGRERTALAASLITYRPKSAIRDVGKALGLDLEQVDRLAKSLAWWDGRKIAPERLREVGFDPDNPIILKLMTLVHLLIGFPRHLSQHVGGFVISQGLLSRLVPIENAAMPQRTVIQWDKDDLNALGLLKVDCLALGMLTAIHRAMDLLSAYHGKPYNMSTIPKEDPAVYEMIGRADTMGVFQVESRAQMAMLPRFKPRVFYDLVIEVAIVRPGPIQGGMVHPYLRRRQGLEQATYPSKAVEGVLKRTLGVPIFQEQVMELAIVAAGFTAEEADRLRRSMAAWRRSGSLGPFEQRLIDGMHERGYTEEYAKQIFKMIQGFGEYGFPESHSVSFALLVYISAWIKCHEPAAFTCALLNSQPMGFYAPAQLVQDAQRHGIKVLPVDVTVSNVDCALETVENKPAVRLGLRMVKGLSSNGAERIVNVRKHSPFENVEDLARQAKLNRRDLESLAAANALNPLAGHRRQAHWQVAGAEPALPLTQHAPIAEAALHLPAPSEGENIAADYMSLGLTLGRHPLELLRPKLSRLGLTPAIQLRNAAHGKWVYAAGIVINRQRPLTASGVTFLTLEDEAGTINIVVWQTIAQRQRRALLSSRLLAVRGVLEKNAGTMHLIAKNLIDYTHLLGKLPTVSRDFH